MTMKVQRKDPTTLGLILCRCGHSQRAHERWLEACQADGDALRWYGSGCPCVRFTEAPFAAQQIPLFTVER